MNNTRQKKIKFAPVGSVEFVRTCQTFDFQNFLQAASTGITTDSSLSLDPMYTRVRNDAVNAPLSFSQHHRVVTMPNTTTNNRIFKSDKSTTETFARKLTSSNSVENEANTEGCHVPISPDRKTVNIAHLIDEKLRKRKKFFSFELFLNKKYSRNVYERFISEVSRISPLFYATTWHEPPSSEKTPTYPPLKIHGSFPNNTLMHVAANDLSKDEIRTILNNALAHGKTNIFVLRGDNCTGNGDFQHAVDLVRFIRLNYGNKFVICVAGFPQMHPESVSKEMDIMYLKEKVEAGADFVITQIFLESEVFVRFVEDCRSSGIRVPIIPGIFPIQSYKSLARIAKLCSFEIPRKVLQDIEPIKNDDRAVCNYGVQLARTLISEIFTREAASGFHLFTLNRVSVCLDVCERILD